MFVAGIELFFGMVVGAVLLILGLLVVARLVPYCIYACVYAAHFCSEFVWLLFTRRGRAEAKQHSAAKRAATQNG